MDPGRDPSDSDAGKGKERSTESIPRWQQHLLPKSAADPPGEEDDKEEMFNAPRYVIKDGVTVIKDHEFATDHKGKLLHTNPGYNQDISKEIEPFFEDYYSVKFNNYAISDDYLHHHEVVPTNPKS